MASDSDFFVIRRFEKLGARVALFMQNKISHLEETVNAEDARCAFEGGDNGTFNGDYNKQRQDALEELVWRLERYREYHAYERFVLDYSELKARPDASKSQITYVKNWLENNNGPIVPAEAAFIEKEDLMPMVPKVRPPLRRLIDKFDSKIRIPYWRIPNEKVRIPKSSR
ncbi:MAG: hypothetical protein Q9223_001455 [Gallowayella weberi]